MAGLQFARASAEVSRQPARSRSLPVTRARLTLKGAWIDAAYDGAVVTLAAVGSPLHYLVKPPTSIPARHKQSEERGRLRRLAVAALRDAGADEAIDEAELEWSYRAG